MSIFSVQFSDADAGTRISAEQFAEADFKAPFIYERVKGRLVVMSPAGPEHRLVSRPFRREYHDIGVREYVIVDRFKRKVLVLTHVQAEDYQERWLSDGDYTTPYLPGLRVSLAEAFAVK